MGKIFTPVSFNRVRKLEFPDLINGVVAIVDSYNPETMHVAETFQLLLEAKPQLSNLVLVNKKMPETNVLVGLRLKRKKLLQSLVRQTKAMSVAAIDSQLVHLKIVEPFVLTYWSQNFKEFNNKAITERLKQMLVALDSDQNLSEAFTALGLTLVVDELKTIQAGLVANTDSRRKANSLLPKMNTVSVKSTLGTALTDLLNAITLAVKAHPEQDYTPMVNELNVLLNSYQAEIKARITRSKNEKRAEPIAPLSLATAV